MDTSIQASINSLCRNIRRVYNLPPDERENAEAFFALMDILNAAGRLEQDALSMLNFRNC